MSGGVGISTLTSEEMVALEDRYGSAVYAKQPLCIVRGEGARVWDDQGGEYIDCIGGHQRPGSVPHRVRERAV
jgi:acetylornithine/succinyldiaminopimelate/putrescine aminotransferase